MLIMLTHCNVNMSDAAELFGEPPSPAGMTPAQTALYLRRGLVAFGVEENGQLAGLSIAESRPRGVHILGMEGRTGACLLLLERLVRFAGERDLSAWCPASRPDVRHMLVALVISHATSSGQWVCWRQSLALAPEMTPCVDADLAP
jgi:hypothetical protein